MVVTLRGLQILKNKLEGKESITFEGRELDWLRRVIEHCFEVHFFVHRMEKIWRDEE